MTTKSERLRERETRKHRLRETQGMSIHTVIEFGLVKRSDWVDIAGAEYPRNKDWKKRRDGSIYFVGSCGTNVYPKEVEK